MVATDAGGAEAGLGSQGHLGADAVRGRCVGVVDLVGRVDALAKQLQFLVFLADDGRLLQELVRILH